MNENLQSYEVLYLGKLPDIFSEDIVDVVGLPVGVGGFENVSGGYTNTIGSLLGRFSEHAIYYLLTILRKRQMH